MSKALMSLPIMILFLFSVSDLIFVTAQKTWCVAKPSSDENILQANINFACSQPNVDCSVIKPGCTCSLPDYLINRASVAMNLYYQSTGRHDWNCDFGKSGVTVITNPSYGNCVYQ